MGTGQGGRLWEDAEILGRLAREDKIYIWMGWEESVNYSIYIIICTPSITMHGEYNSILQGADSPQPSLVIFTHAPFNPLINSDYITPNTLELINC